MMAKPFGLWHWLGERLIPPVDVPRPNHLEHVATDRALTEADRAEREFQALMRRAKAVGIDVDVSRSWRPRGDD